MELRFVKVSRSDTTRHQGTLRLVKDDSGRVRTQVIFDSEWKERQQDAEHSPGSESRQLMWRPSPVAYTIHSPELWRSSFVQAMVADLFPKEIGYGRLLADDFAFHCSNNAWAPVIAIHDAMALLHVGSTSNDNTLLIEAKKRYVFSISELRQALSPQGPQVSAEAILVVSMGLMLSEVLPPEPSVIIVRARDNAGCEIRPSVFVYHADLHQDVLGHFAWLAYDLLVPPCGWHIRIFVYVLFRQLCSSMAEIFTTAG